MDRHFGGDWLAGAFELAAAHFEDVLAEVGTHAAGEDDAFHFAGGLEDKGGERGAGAMAEEEDFSGAELGDGGGVGADVKRETRFGAIAGRAFAIADAGLFDADGFVAGAGEGVEELGLRGSGVK